MNSPFANVGPLEGRIVRLDPLTAEHLPALTGLAEADAAAFRWLSGMETAEGRRRWLQTAVDEARQGVSLPFVIRLQADGSLVGTTRFAALSEEHLRAEIGWTWLAPRAQRTGANREAKYLMLRHAFKVWGLRRIEFKTNLRNSQSRAALAALGAVEEATLRAHTILPDGSRRDNVCFSILAEEFPAIAARLTGAAIPGV